MDDYVLFKKDITLITDNGKIIFQDAKELYSNEKYYQEILKGLGKCKEGFNENSQLNRICYIIDNVDPQDKESVKNQIQQLLKKLFLDLIDSKHSALVIKILLRIDDLEFVNRQIKKNKEEILLCLNRCCIYDMYSPLLDDLSFDGFLKNDKEIITIDFNENKVIKEFIKCLFLELDDSFIDTNIFDNLLYKNKVLPSNKIFEDSRFSKCLEYARFSKEFTMFYYNLIKKHKKINFFMLLNTLEDENIPPALENIQIADFTKEDSSKLRETLLLDNLPLIAKKQLLFFLVTTKINKESCKISNDFFESLEILKNAYQTSKDFKLVMKLPEYFKCRDLFLHLMKKIYLITTNNYDNSLIQLFNKLIRKDNLFKLCCFQNLRDLLHYNRTNIEHLKTSSFIDGDLNNYNVKKYNSLYKKINSKVNNSYPKINDGEYDFICELSLKLLLLFDYNNANRLIDIYNLNELSSFINFFNTSDSDYLKKEEDYINYLLKNNRIFDKNNSFLLSSRDNYFYLKSLFGYEPSLNQLKLIKSYKEINVTPNINLLIPYFDFINSKNYSNYISESINMYYRYRDRIFSTIPDLEGVWKDFSYRTIDMQDARACFLGNEIKCCLTPIDKAKSALEHALINKNGRLFGVFDDDNLVALSWIWRNNGLLCFDNIEVNSNYIKFNNLGNRLLTIYLEVAKKIYQLSKNNEPENERITRICLGRNKNDILMSNLKNLVKLSPDTIKKYVPKNSKNLYINDSQQEQYILYDDEKDPLLQSDSTTIYKRTRMPFIDFNNINAYDLKNKIDYIRYRANLPIETKSYISGVIGDDYYIGITSNFELEVAHFGTDDRRYRELDKNLSKIKDDLVKYQQKEREYLLIKEALLKSKYQSDIDKFKSEEEKVPIINLDIDNYYHGTTLENAISILDQRKIACNFRCANRNEKPLGEENKAFHICVTKKMKNIFFYNIYVLNGISFVLNKNLPITMKGKAHRFDKNNIREIPFSDEFQVKDTISLDSIEAIALPINKESDLEKARIISDALEIFNIQLPIIDINKQKILSNNLIRKCTVKK